MAKKTQSQLVDLFLSVASELGVDSDRDIASLAGVSVENVANWRTGAVQEFKPQKLASIKRGLAARVGALREQAGAMYADPELGLHPIEVEEDVRAA